VSGTRIHYGATFAVLAVSAVGFSLLQSLVLPTLPSLEHALHTSATAASWLLTAYLLSAAIATPLLGRVGDMIGKKQVLVMVLVALALGTMVSALADSLPLMLAGRVVQGAGGAVFPLAFGIIRDEFPPAKVASGIGIISSLLGIGAGAGMVLAGPIIAHQSYHWLFWYPFFMIVAATVATWVFVPESPVRSEGRVNWLGGSYMSGWLITGLIALTEAPTWGWTSPAVLGLFVATVVLMFLWGRSEMRSSAPLVDMRMMRNTSVWTTNLAALLFGFGMYALFIVVPQFVQTPVKDGYGFGASVTQSGLFLAPLAVAMLLIAPLTGRLTAVVGSKSLLISGAVFGAGSYAFLAAEHAQRWDIYLASGLLGVGVALGFASMANLIIEAVPSHQTGVATGMNTNIRSIGGALGSTIATSIVVSSLLPSGFPREHGFVAAFVICSASLAIAAAAALAVPGRRKSATAFAPTPLLAEAEVFAGPGAFAPEVPS
jgi:MFS family permease